MAEKSDVNSKKDAISSQRQTRVEQQLSKQQKKKEEMRFLEELGKRITVAREARSLFEKQKYAEALTYYRRFLFLTAKGFKTEIETLSPEMFDEKLRVRECLLISSALLDLSKLLDKLESAEAAAERNLYLKLFIRFTMGQVFQSHSAQNLKRYLTYARGVKNPKEFWATYNVIQLKKFCVIAHAVLLESDQEAFEKLWWFRDQVLARHRPGRTFINFYYSFGPLLASWLEKRRKTRTLLRAVILKLLN